MCDLPSESELITLNFFYARMTRRLWLPNVFFFVANSPQFGGGAQFSCHNKPRQTPGEKNQTKNK
jgi:hypothetical protein